MEPEQKSNGALVGLVVIIIILILGGFYIWSVNKDEETPTPLQQENQNLTQEDESDIDNLDKDLQSADVNTGVDINTVN